MNLKQLIKQDEVQPSRYFAVKVESFSNLIESIQKKLWKDSQCRSILQELGKAGHPGQEKTLKLVKLDFHWSGMTQFIKDYVSSFQQCSRNKNIHNKKFGLLKPLPISNCPWICFSMDLITQLPLSNSFHSILFIVDRFSKMAVFIPRISSITSLDLAHLFIKNIFSKHGLPSSIVSDRGPLFVSSFWTNLCQKLTISRDLSTEYHPETDGQTERVNQILEQYLHMYQSPFLTVYGRDTQCDSVQITQDNPAGKFSTEIQPVQKDVKREIEAAVSRFKRYADKSRASPPEFKPGEMVWLSSKNIKSTRLIKTFSERWLGPFPIMKKVSAHAYHLKLPSQWKSLHPVFHISLLEPERNQQSQIGIKRLLLLSSFKTKRNGKSLRYWIQSSREENYGIWWNGKVAVKTQKDPPSNKLKN
ncbi:hypothetical protein O181_063361 [Austropuccinia psidii MF-1]|uniref:Integrase catalytic domain-containing protein n=1 Tax=Austropuccinia psidii MF-1 TaxID=1389203 RepID=A0A9Q3HZC7_9BASI|nr:hypothetical protein [Austropuccinia psidii MF-1]